MEPRRASVGAVLADVRHAGDYLGQPGMESWDAGRARNEKVLAWARREAAALRAADPSVQLPPAAAAAPAPVDDPEMLRMAEALLVA
jgi:hypothetical protein